MRRYKGVCIDRGCLSRQATTPRHIRQRRIRPDELLNTCSRVSQRVRGFGNERTLERCGSGLTVQRAPRSKSLGPGDWYPHPELNGDPRFRKPLLYPFELWGQRALQSEPSGIHYCLGQTSQQVRFSHGDLAVPTASGGSSCLEPLSPAQAVGKTGCDKTLLQAVRLCSPCDASVCGPE